MAESFPHLKRQTPKSDSTDVIQPMMMTIATVGGDVKLCDSGGQDAGLREVYVRLPASAYTIATATPKALSLRIK